MNLHATDVLIVDDREDGLVALEAVLKDIRNLNVVRASSGREALSLLESHDFAVILLDVQMPDLDGFQTAKIIREKFEKYHFTPIIFVTAINQDDEYIYKGYQAGAVDYLFKPFEPHILRSKVNVFIDLYQKTRLLKAQSDIIRESEKRERYLRMAELELDGLKRYQRLADAIPHIVWKLKTDGGMEYFNKVWLDYAGFEEHQTEGSHWQDAIDGGDLNLFLKSWINSMNTRLPFQVECRIRRSDQEMRWHWIKAVPELLENEIVAWLVTCTDIHDRKISEARLKKAEQDANFANNAKTNFLANMSHEIRTPMGAILGFAELLLSPKKTEEERLNFISIIRRNGQQLLHIIDEILDISKVEAGLLETESIEFDLQAMAQDLYSLLKVQSDKKNLNLDFSVLNSLPQMVLSDPTRLRQILMNVIGNAIKFTQEGGVVVEMKWNPSLTDLRKGRLNIYVHDTGVGMDEAQSSKLFQPFTQVDSTTTRKFGGTGLGLALSKKLAEALGGNVSIPKTEAGRGSTFKIEISVTASPETLWFEHIYPEEKPVQKVAANDGAESLKGIRVLLVDDALDNQTVIKWFLSAVGASVEVASNGIEGVEKALLGQHDLVLMDIQMPELDGYGALKALQEKGYQRPVIALTAHALKEERDRCFAAGFSEHFTKPVDRLKLISLIDGFVRKADLQTPNVPTQKSPQGGLLAMKH